MSKKRIDCSGSTLDSLLEQDGILAEVGAVAIERVAEWQRRDTKGVTSERKKRRMTGRHPISKLWSRMSPAARARAEQEARTLRRLIEEGRASGEPVEGQVVLRRLRDKYAAMAMKTGREQGDDP